MSSQALSLSITPSLAKNPRTVYKQWRLSSFTAARSLAPGLDPYGAMCLVMTPDEWNDLSLNRLTHACPAVPGAPAILAVPAIAPTTLDPIGSPAILASPAILDVPAIPATFRPMTDWSVPTPPTSTGHTVRDAYKRAFEKHQVFSQASIILSQILLVSIGPDLTTQISDPLTGTFDLTPIAIMNAMTTLYGDGNLTVQDLERLRLPLKTKLLSLATFLSHVASFRRTYTALTQADQPLSTHDAFTYFHLSIAHHQPLHIALEQYHSTHPTLASHTFESLVAHLTPQMPYLVSTASQNPFAGGIPEVPRPRTPRNPRTKPALTPAQLEVLVAMKAQGFDVSHLLAQQSGTPTPPRRPQHESDTPPTATSLYCYRHGWQKSHVGASCKVMTAAPDTFTPAQVLAQTPLAVAGGSKKFSPSTKVLMIPVVPSLPLPLTPAVLISSTPPNRLSAEADPFAPLSAPPTLPTPYSVDLSGASPVVTPLPFPTLFRPPPIPSTHPLFQNHGPQIPTCLLCALHLPLQPPQKFIPIDLILVLVPLVVVVLVVVLVLSQIKRYR